MTGYRTRDSQLAAFLLVHGYHPDVRAEGDVVFFVYPQSMRHLKDRFHRGATVRAVEYAQALRLVKAWVRAALEAA